MCPPCPGTSSEKNVYVSCFILWKTAGSISMLIGPPIFVSCDSYFYGPVDLVEEIHPQIKMENESPGH